MPNYNINVADPFQGLQGVVGEHLGRQKQEGLEEEARALYESGDINALADFSIANPEMGQRVREQTKFKSAETEAVRRDMMRKIMMGGDHVEIITEGADAIDRMGGDSSNSRKLLEMPAEEVLDITGKSQAMQFPADSKAVSEFRKGQAGLSSDLPAESRAFNDLIKDFTPKQQKTAKLVKAGLRGRAMSNAVLSAIESGDISNLAEAKAEIAQAEKFGSLTGASRSKAIDKGFDSIIKIDRGMKNIDDAISALDRGAGVGAVEKIWPSIKAASVELDNVRGRMALDVVGATTFGALSKGELDLAKDIALPTGLDTDELKDYLTRKKAAQTKLRAYYNEQIQFLDSGGTVAGFLRKKESEQGGASAEPQGAEPASVSEGATATNAAGEQVKFTNGQWVPI